MSRRHARRRPAADPADTLHLGRWTVTSGSNVQSRGAVVITAGDHQWQASAEGNGAVDALFRAVDRALAGVLTGHPRLVAYDVHAVAEGPDAEGNVTVTIEPPSARRGRAGERPLHRRVASTNIIAASIEAYIDAINALLAEEHCGRDRIGRQPQAGRGVHEPPRPSSTRRAGPTDEARPDRHDGRGSRPVGGTRARTREPSAIGRDRTARVQCEAPPRSSTRASRARSAEEAVIGFFGEERARLAVPTWRAVFEAVADGSAERGVIAIESSLAGTIRETYDLLAEFDDRDIRIVGEVAVPVRLALLALPGQSLDWIDRVYSHAQALVQADAFLRSRAWQVDDVQHRRCRRG